MGEIADMGEKRGRTWLVQQVFHFSCEEIALVNLLKGSKIKKTTWLAVNMNPNGKSLFLAYTGHQYSSSDE